MTDSQQPIDSLAARVDEAAAVGMQSAVWADVQPDRIAIYDYTGQDRTFAELNANANRIVRLLRPGRARARRLGGPALLEPCRVLRRPLRRAPRRDALHAGQLASDRRGDRLHRQRLRGQGVVRGRPHCPGSGDGGSPMSERHGQDQHRRHHRWLYALRGCTGTHCRLEHPRPRQGLHHALHLRHDRSAEGGSQTIGRLRRLRSQRGSRARHLSVHRARLPRRAARGQCQGAADERHSNRPARQVGQRSRLEHHPRETHHALTPRAHHVSTSALAAGGRTGALRSQLAQAHHAWAPRPAHRKSNEP